MTRSLRRVFSLLCLTGVVCTGTVGAADFYSWIDPSGTMVMTDDPTHIPASVSRSPVSIHRFEDLVDYRPTPPKAKRQQRAAREDVPDIPTVKPGPEAIASAQPAEPADPSDAHQLVLLEAPDGAAHREYVWVPLLAPVLLGSTQVSGFWCHRSVSSPVDAFQVFLAQHGAGATHQVLVAGGQLQLGNLFNRPGSSRFSRTRSGVGPTGPSVYNQVLQEQRALVDRAMAPFQSSGGSPPTGRIGRARAPGGQRSHAR